MDIDGDGHRDILSGSYSRMSQDMAGLFQILRGQPDGSYRKAEELKGTDGEPLIIPIKSRDEMTKNICTRPFAVDWDGDGHLDLVVGNFAGSFYWFKGQGKGKFQPRPVQLNAGEFPLEVTGAHSDPFVVDWDGDGDLDLLSGSSGGGVYWAVNRAGKGRVPELTAFQTLIEPGRQVAYGEILSEKDLSGPTRATRVWADDVNGDGKLDLLVGDSVTLLAPAKGLSEQEFRKRFTDWQEEIRKASSALNAGGGDAKAQARAREEFQRAYERRTEFMTEDMTGFVWLYLQK